MVLTGCIKDHCDYQNGDEINLSVNIGYSLDWYPEWKENVMQEWPADWKLDWDQIYPGEPDGVRIHVFEHQHSTPVLDYNFDRYGGRIKLLSGYYDMLFYNNDTEGILFQNVNAVNDAIATTRSRTGTPYTGRYPDEKTVSPPDKLFAGFLDDVEIEEPQNLNTDRKIEVKLEPRTWTYIIRYEFASGLEYVVESEAYLSGMAGTVSLKDGITGIDEVTLLLNCSVSENGIVSVVRSFGLPEGKSSGFNRLVLELTLESGKIKVIEFDVTDQVQNHPHGGVIAVKNIIVTSEEGKRPDNGSGFDGDVNDWDDNQDIEIPID